MNDFYILDGHRVVACPDIRVWSRWMETFDRRQVASTKVGSGSVSTVFLGMDHGWGSLNDRAPIVFESLVFGGPLDEEMVRYSTWCQAKAGHLEMVRRCRAAERWPYRVLRWVMSLLRSLLPERTKL